MHAYTWTLITFIVHLSFAQVDLFQAWHTRRCYERTRGQLFCALHYKALKRRDIGGKTTSKDEDGVSKDKDESADLGKIVNLMQGDAYAVAQRFWEFSGIFASPVRLVIALVFLYRYDVLFFFPVFSILSTNQHTRLERSLWRGSGSGSICPELSAGEVQHLCTFQDLSAL